MQKMPEVVQISQTFRVIHIIADDGDIYLCGSDPYRFYNRESVTTEEIRA